jgi:hypothetical protein
MDYTLPQRVTKEPPYMDETLQAQPEPMNG